MLKRMGFLMGVGLTLVYVRGLMLDVMDVDASQYAAMSLELLSSDNWLHFYYRGAEYLDKPPLLFWLSAISFKLFGVSNWAYKLPCCWRRFGARTRRIALRACIMPSG